MLLQVGDVVQCNNPSASDGLLKEGGKYEVIGFDGNERIILGGVKTRFDPHSWYATRFSYLGPGPNSKRV